MYMCVRERIMCVCVFFYCFCFAILTTGCYRFIYINLLLTKRVKLKEIKYIYNVTKEGEMLRLIV